MYERLNPETKHGAIGGGHDQSRNNCDSAKPERFTLSTAKATGRSERAVQMAAALNDLDRQQRAIHETEWMKWAEDEGDGQTERGVKSVLSDGRARGRNTRSAASPWPLDFRRLPCFDVGKSERDYGLAFQQDWRLGREHSSQGASTIRGQAVFHGCR